MMRAIGLGVTLLAVGAGGFYARSLLGPAGAVAPPDPVTHVQRPSGPTIEQIQKLSRLVVLQVPISDVQVSELQGFTGGLRLILAVHGDVEIATDLSAAGLEEIDHENRSAVLVLPRPRPQRPRLDHEKTRILQLQRDGLWRWVTGQAGESALANRAMAHAQQLLADTAARADLAEQACQHTETIMREFFGAMDWNVTVQWKEPVALQHSARTLPTP